MNYSQNVVGRSPCCWRSQGTPNQLPEFPSQKSKLRYNIQDIDQRDKKMTGCKKVPPILPPETRGLTAKNKKNTCLSSTAVAWQNWHVPLKTSKNQLFPSQDTTAREAALLLLQNPQDSRHPPSQGLPIVAQYKGEQHPQGKPRPTECPELQCFAFKRLFDVGIVWLFQLWASYSSTWRASVICHLNLKNAEKQSSKNTLDKSDSMIPQSLGF